MKFLFLFFFLIASGSSFALDCSKADNTIEINQCAQIRQTKTDEELNEAYQRVLAMLEGINKEPDNRIKTDLKAGLIKAQRLWVKFREADCANIYDFWSNGTIRSVMYSDCMRGRAEQRIKELDEYQRP